MVRKAEEKWGTGIVNQVSLDLQAEFPETKGFSARNLWFMKQWYSFYATNPEIKGLISDVKNQINVSNEKLNQLGSEIQEGKLNQLDSELMFPAIFAFVPWKHHVLIMQKSKSVGEALFYVQKTVEGNLSRNTLDSNNPPIRQSAVSADLKERHQQILSVMETGRKYSSDEVAELVGLKISRTKQLLKELTDSGKVEASGGTRGKRYKARSQVKNLCELSHNGWNLLIRQSVDSADLKMARKYICLEKIV